MKLKKEQVLDDFRSMIRLKTVSHDDGSLTDREEFRKLRALIKERFPVLFERGEGWVIGEYGVLIRIPGKSESDPSVLMAHMDVVEADGGGWTHDPFGAEISGGRIYGRGTLDTKCTLLSILQAVSFRLANGFVPEHDIWLSFGGEEETCGPCCREIVSFLRERGVKPAFVLDEGGSVIPEGVPGLRKQAAMIGIAEKGTANYMLSIRKEGGGHASVPPKSTVIGRLARAAVAIEKHPFPARLSEPVKLMFRELAPYVPVYERPVFEHPELTSPAIAAAASVLGGTFGAMVRSTCAVTIMEGHSSFNVLPDSAAMGVNVRLLEGDTVESAAERLRKIAGDPDISVDIIAGTDPSPVADIRCREYGILKDTIAGIWPGTVIAPYQMNGGTDARFYAELTDRIYRFSPMIMTKDDRSRVHGVDESIAIPTLFRMIRFYISLTGRL